MRNREDCKLKTGLLLDDVFLDHCAAGHHPEQPQRLVVIRRELERLSLSSRCSTVEPRPATDEEILSAHTPEYLRRLKETLPGSRGHIDLDTFYSPGTWEAALMAAGGTIELCARVFQGELRNGAAFVRPPGHHAGPNRSQGFCILNNIAIAARQLIRKGARRVAIVDWDIHHGNGTQDIFYSDAEVLYASIHMYPYYPGTGHYTEIGEGPGRGYNLNMPVPPRSGFAETCAAFRSIILPVLTQFRPDAILVSCGFDSHAGDPLGALRLDTESFRKMNGWLLAKARELCHDRLVLVLEGGYDLRSLAEASTALVGDLIASSPEEAAPICPDPAMAPVRRMLEDLTSILEKHWEL